MKQQYSELELNLECLLKKIRKPDQNHFFFLS